MSRHLGDQVSAYVDRRLPGSALSAWDRHVVVCAHCRYAVDQERSLLASLRTAPAPCVSDSLQALLLGMGAALVAGLAAGASAAAAWTVGLAPVAVSAAPAGAPIPARVGSSSGLGAAYSGMLSFPVSQVGFSTVRFTATTNPTETSGR